MCRLQKPPRIAIEKPLTDIYCRTSEQSPIIIDKKCNPGDRDDNLWVTLNNYQVPDSQIDWEQTCFLDKPFHGYYVWPKLIKYYLNKRLRYARDTMPEPVAIIYDCFIDKNFLKKLTESLMFDEDEVNFNKNRFQMYKVGIETIDQIDLLLNSELGPY